MAIPEGIKHDREANVFWLLFLNQFDVAGNIVFDWSEAFYYASALTNVRFGTNLVSFECRVHWMLWTLWNHDPSQGPRNLDFAFTIANLQG